MNLFYKKIISPVMRPMRTYNYIVSLVVGYLYRIKYCFILRKAVFGRKIRVRGKLKISGPGKVIIGDNVTIDGRGHAVTPFTHSEEAVIIIGSDSFINGTRFGCQKKITIGAKAILGDARILDTDFHSIYRNRWAEDAVVGSAPIEIGENVWVGANSAVLKGVKIGDNSVVGFGSVVTTVIPCNCVVAGNPARIIKEITD